jgi:hypothetical protein
MTTFIATEAAFLAAYAATVLLIPRRSTIPCLASVLALSTLTYHLHALVLTSVLLGRYDAASLQRSTSTSWAHPNSFFSRECTLNLIQGATSSLEGYA